jgi:hypothetical protein
MVLGPMEDQASSVAKIEGSTNASSFVNTFLSRHTFGPISNLIVYGLNTPANKLESTSFPDVFNLYRPLLTKQNRAPP